MSSFSLPSSNQDQMTSLPQNSASNTPTPESSLDSAGFCYDPFDVSFLHKSNDFYICTLFANFKCIFIFYIALLCKLMQCIFIYK